MYSRGAVVWLQGDCPML